MFTRLKGKEHLVATVDTEFLPCLTCGAYQSLCVPWKSSETSSFDSFTLQEQLLHALMKAPNDTSLNRNTPRPHQQTAYKVYNEFGVLRLNQV